MTDADQSRPEGKPWIMGIHAYVPGKAVSADGTQLIKLSANENPLGTSEAAHAARKAEADSAEYPDPDARELRLKIGEVHGLDPVLCNLSISYSFHTA